VEVVPPVDGLPPVPPVPPPTTVNACNFGPLPVLVAFAQNPTETEALAAMLAKPEAGVSVETPVLGLVLAFQMLFTVDAFRFSVNFHELTAVELPFTTLMAAQ
jgi:hypothetical protein